MTILIVEDHHDYLTLLKLHLKIRGYADVQAATNGSSALDKLKGTVFDVVICDLNMPDLTGHEVFQVMRANGHPSKFLLWTSADRHAIPKFEGTGFLGVVPKTDFEGLFNKLLTA